MSAQRNAGPDTPPWADTPSSQHYGIRSTIGRYASYWNAFLLLSTMKLRRLCFYRCVGWYPSMPCRWYPSMPCSRSPKGGGACSWGGEVCCLLREGGCGDPPKEADGYCCGRYASYWNAFFLLTININLQFRVNDKHVLIFY